MKCIEAEKKLDAFFDGEIISSKEIEAHLENCASCQTIFENLGAMRRTLKQNFTVSTPPLLGEKVLSAFQKHHKVKRDEPKRKPEKIGWFGVPRFALAAAMILFTLATISAFQIGRLSASEIVISLPQIEQNSNSTQIENEFEPQEMTTKIVEIPVIKEKIVEVPVIREKIVTKTIYVYKPEKSTNFLTGKEDFALTNKIDDNKYLTRSNLEGFQPVSEMNLRISKEVNQK